MSRVSEVLRPEYISSEESEIDEKTNKVSKYNVRSLSWESRALRRAKRKLDKLHTASLSDLVKRRINLREVGLPSNRPKPLNCPDWAAAPIAELPDATVDGTLNDSILNDSILDDSF
jgi:hypothetical protein